LTKFPLEARQHIRSLVAIYDLKRKTSTIVNSDEYRYLFTSAGNSIIASCIVPNIPTTTKSFNSFLIYALNLIQQLATNSLNSKKINNSTIIIPRGIFPLPPAKDDYIDDYKKEVEQRKKIIDAEREKIKELAQNLEGNNNAIKEIIDAFAKSGIDTTRKSPGFYLSKDALDKLSNETKEILIKHRLFADEMEITRSISILERAGKDITDKLRKCVTNGTKMIKVGSVLVPDNYFNSKFLRTYKDNSYLRTRGLCAPVPADEPTADVTTPIGHGQAYAHTFSELMVVEQNLSGYELSEIAHIENVLKSEIRTRRLNVKRTREESELTETEVKTEKTEDLSTTERFELANESQNTINENRSTDVGVTVNASYGPSVDVTGNYNHSSSTSTQDSHSASTNFSRETTNHAINKIEKRTLTRRFIRTVEEVDELNKHVRSRRYNWYL
jgi:hypothetical protein